MVVNGPPDRVVLSNGISTYLKDKCPHRLARVAAGPTLLGPDHRIGLDADGIGTPSYR